MHCYGKSTTQKWPDRVDFDVTFSNHKISAQELHYYHQIQGLWFVCWFVIWLNWCIIALLLQSKSLLFFDDSLWRIYPTTVSVLLKSEQIEIHKKFKFLEKSICVWKFLKASRASRTTSVRNGIETKIFGDQIVLENHFFL